MPATRRGGLAGHTPFENQLPPLRNLRFCVSQLRLDSAQIVYRSDEKTQETQKPLACGDARTQARVACLDSRVIRPVEYCVRLHDRFVSV